MPYHPKRLAIFAFIFPFLTGFGPVWALQTLELAQILKRVDASFPEILAARAELRQAQGAYLSAKGRFDPSMNIYSRNEPVGGYVNGFVDNEFSVPTLQNGMRLFGAYRLGRGDFPVYDQNYLTNSGGEYRAGVEMPLFRDRAIDRPRTELLTKQIEINMRKANIALTRIQVYHEAIQSYWRWVAAGLKLKAFESLLKLAKERQTAIIKKVELGDLAQIAIAENEQQILQRQQLVNESQMLLQQAAFQLGLYYRDKSGKPILPDPSQIPTLNELIERDYHLNTIQIPRDEIKKHPVLAKMQGQEHIARAELNLARNELMPNLDALTFLQKDFGNGNPQLSEQAVRVGLRYYFPIYQREAKGKVIVYHNELHRIARQKQYMNERLIVEAQKLGVEAQTYKKQLSIINREYTLAKQVEVAEVKRFFSGDSNLFLVNQREQMTMQTLLHQIEIATFLQKTHDLLRYFLPKCRTLEKRTMTKH